MFTRTFVVAVLLCCANFLAAQQQEPIRLRIDLSDAARHLVHVTEQVAVHPGTNDFWYPQWIPGQELPGGPIDNLTGLVFRAGRADSAVVPWRRDLMDPFEFHVQVPDGVASLAIAFDVLEVPSRFNTIGTNVASSHLAMVEPSEVVLYPAHTPVNTIEVTPAIHLPATWRAATALRVDEAAPSTLNGPDTTFGTVSLEQFVDSPILAGDHCRQYPLAPELHPAHTLDVCAETDSSAALTPEFLTHMAELVRQATKVFQAHHYNHFDFLVALSPHLSGDSMEHTQSAHYVLKGATVDDAALADFVGYVMPHEYTHSWCGKYHRPAGVATADFNTPMQNEMLWVYEGLTEYYGNLLSARSGFYTPEQVVNRFDFAVFGVDQPGRVWRNVQDTADASAVLRGNDTGWANWRLSQNYYQEGALLWLEADLKIRQMSHGTKSLDDFAASFLGSDGQVGKPRDSGPGVVPYRFADVIAALNATQPYDWEGFWQTRLTALTPKLPTAGLEAAGYDYVYGEEMSPAEARFITAAHMAEMIHSLGFQVMPDGTLMDVWMGSPAFTAGLGPGDKLTQVNGKPYTPEALTGAVRDAKGRPGPVTLTFVRDDETHTVSVPYHDGLRFSTLRRNGNPNLLMTAILKAK